jgi:hypothetical protein
VQGTTSTAAPLPSYPSDQAPKSAQDPAPNPKLTASQSPSAQNTAEDTSLPGPKVSDPVAQDPAADLPQEPAGQAPNETPKTTKGNKNNVWPPPASDFDIPETTDALSILKSALASAQATGAADPQDSSPSQHQSTGQQEDIEGSYPDGTEDPSDLSDSINHASGDPSKPEQVVAEWTHDGEAFTAISTDGSAVIKGGDDVATVAAGSVETFRGQSVSVPLDGSHAKVDDSALSFSPVEMATGDGLGNTPSTATVLTAAAIWTHENEVFTTILTDGSAVVHGGGGVATVEPGKVETFEGQAISVPLEGNLVKVDDQVLSFSTVEMTTATGSQQDDTLSTAVFTASGRAITAMVHGSSLVLQAAGTATTIAHGAEVTFVGQTVSFPKSGGDVLGVDGQSVTMQALASGGSNARIPAPAVWTQGGSTFTAQVQGDSTIVFQAPSTTMRLEPGSTITLGDRVYSVPAAGGVLVHDETSVTLDRAMATDSAAIAATSKVDSNSISAFDAGNSVVVIVGDKTFTLADGAQTSLDHHVISAQSTGGLVVVDGTTLAASTRVSVRRSSDSGGSGDTGDSTATSGSTLDSAAATNVSVRMATILILLGIAAIAWI